MALQRDLYDRISDEVQIGLKYQRTINTTATLVVSINSGVFPNSNPD